MKIVSVIEDQRIGAKNLLLDLSIEEYIELARKVIDKNEFQRKRVRNSKSVYSLLKADIRQGCVIPPIVLAVTSQVQNDSLSDDKFSSFLQENHDHLVILDGLQRTHTILELVSDLVSAGDDDSLRSVLKHTIRAEVYAGLNRPGILYRMLTLNTGQTPMSLRQQIEMLYLDYAATQPHGIELITEASGRVAGNDGQYNFKEVIEGFNSYLHRSELPIDRADILENIQSLEKLAIENRETEIFEEYLKAWHAFFSKVCTENSSTELSPDFMLDCPKFFGSTLSKVFKKAQAMAGFGAAIGHLRDYEELRGFAEAEEALNNLKPFDPEALLEELNTSLAWIQGNTRKIGNAQRAYFQFFFRDFFYSENESYLDPCSAAKTAFKKFQIQYT